MNIYRSSYHSRYMCIWKYFPIRTHFKIFWFVGIHVRRGSGVGSGFSESSLSPTNKNKPLKPDKIRWKSDIPLTGTSVHLPCFWFFGISLPPPQKTKKIIYNHFWKIIFTSPLNLIGAEKTLRSKYLTRTNKKTSHTWT